ncbi:SGNH/GDSL hydrolase family protein [Paenibacillus agaridevorans]|uniref:SGNH/GDSL hydrolase family protein n=1 Tax=Paenibacillus agaridevorans TaxID=171404 RepID=UPI001BE41875|nr:SGNH/GDSL hydrolase family protein [Paenibacillus agaridevorans]
MLKPKVLEQLQRGERAFIVCIGDSITEQNYHLEGKLNYVGLLTERLMERYNRKSYVFNVGKSGDTSQGILNRLDEDALRFGADLITVMIGINDSVQGEAGIAQFKRNLEQIITRIIASGSEVLLLTQNALDYNIHEQAVQARTAYPEYAAAVREVAAATDTPLCDIYSHWREYVQESTNSHLMLMNDSIHPGAQGHVFIAGQIYHYLNIMPSEEE